MRPARRVAAVWLGMAGLVAACTGGDSDLARPEPGAPDTTATTTTLPPEDRPLGGSVSVRVYGEPDPAAPTLTGAAIRQLVHPQLFVASPDGQWEPSLVEPGSDRLSGDQRSATFRLRDGARWSDGSAITGADLARSADERFVESVEAAGPEITVTFTQALPGWRRLWSGVDSVTPPSFGVWGGPFSVASYTEGLEAVLVRNDRWWGTGPFIDEVRLVLVPSSTMALQLFERGELDVFAPFALTNRRNDLASIDGVEVSSIEQGGWRVVMRANPERLGAEVRAAVLAALDRELFVGTLLKGEAEVAVGYGGAAVWAEPLVADPSQAGSDEITVVGLAEEPHSGLVGKAMQRVLHPAGGRLELVNPQAEFAEPMIAAGDYDVAITPQFDSPDVCWRCRWEGVDAALARAADAGTPGAAGRLQERLRDEGREVPLWRSFTVVGFHGRVNGVRANGWALSPAWNAHDWWVGG